MTSDQKEKITQLRLEGVGYVKIGQLLNLSDNTVRSFCRRSGLTADENHSTVLCKQCGQHITILPKRKPRKFCSDKCRNRWWSRHPECVRRKTNYHLLCPVCGKIFDSYGNLNRKYCSHKCYIADRFGKVCDSDV